MISSTELLALYDAQQRLIVPEHPPVGLSFEIMHGIMRVTGRGEGFIETAHHLELTGDDLDSVIAEHRDYFAARGETVEWKTRAHERGVPYLQVDASDESSPILKRRGFTEITTTTPYVYTPPST